MGTPENLQYMTGFANELATEALPGALPEHQNSPQKCAYGLDRKSTRLNSSHSQQSRMPSSA